MMFEELGNPLTAAEVADALGLAPNTVMKYAVQLGAFRLGGRTLFFEKRVLEALKYGIEDQKERKSKVERSSPTGRTNPPEAIRHESRGLGLGSRDAGIADLGRIPGGSPDADPNRHGLTMEQRVPRRRQRQKDV